MWARDKEPSVTCCGPNFRPGEKLQWWFRELSPAGLSADTAAPVHHSGFSYSLFLCVLFGIVWKVWTFNPVDFRMCFLRMRQSLKPQYLAWVQNRVLYFILAKRLKRQQNHIL